MIESIRFDDPNGLVLVQVGTNEEGKPQVVPFPLAMFDPFQIVPIERDDESIVYV